MLPESTQCDGANVLTEFSSTNARYISLLLYSPLSHIPRVPKNSYLCPTSIERTDSRRTNRRRRDRRGRPGPWIRVVSCRSQMGIPGGDSRITRGQMERYKERMQMLLQNVTARGMWAKVEEMSAEDVMASLRDRRLSDQGGEQICRERLFRARLRRLPATITLDVPWDMNLDDLPDQRSSNESLFDQTMREAPDDGAKKPAQVPDTERAMFGVDFEARLMSMISEAVRSEVNRALGERAKPPVEVAGADVFGALSNSGLRNLPTEGGRPGETPRKSQAPVKAPRKWPRASSTPWDIGAMTGLPCGTLQLNDVSSDGEDLADAQERVKWDDAQRNLKQEDTGALDRSYARAEQRWKYVRLLRETGLRFSGTNDEMGAETFLSRLERYRRRGGIPTDDLLFAVEAVLVDEAAVWYESVEHKVKTWQDFERRFRRSFASQATTDELLTELRQRTQGKGEPISTYLNNFRFLCSRFRVPLPYENQLAIAFRGIRPEYRNFMAHRQITSFSELEQAGKEFENVNRMNAYWHEPIVSASQHYPSAAYKPTERSQLAAVQTERPNDKSSPKKKKGEEEDAKIAGDA
ncbi:unnamed protein product [Trichogramma brassicae]|uniref:Retrotransposon gag domain-containing protein n=1 Tax=Trichogramma brassicae TaxID=86971 RepID=A0A6H5ISR2_9HYME|nr:unnamed protein product [Trichogramma brassicae]